MQGVADTDKGDAGDGGGEGRMDKTGCDCGAGFEKRDEDAGHACKM